MARLPNAFKLHMLSVLCLLVATCLNPAQSQSLAQPRLPSVTLEIDGVSLHTEIARTGNERYMGLSYRTTLGENEGMLFVYPTEQPQLVFTMRNTLLPLSIAYISSDFIINEIHDMDVGPGQQFPSAKPAQFALEVNQGWFKKHNISVGSKLKMQ